MKLFSDTKLKKNSRRYLFQCGLAGAVIFFVLFAMETSRNNVAIAASLGSSAFIVFAAPRSYSARLRSLVGGNLVGLSTGALLEVLIELLFSEGCHGWSIERITAGAAAVAVSMFLMSITDSEHPPAAGLALGVVLSQWSWTNLLLIAVSVTFLGLVKRFFSHRLMDLY